MCTVVPVWCELLEDEKDHISVQFFKKLYINLYSPNIYCSACFLQSILCTKYWQINTVCVQ